MEINITGIGIDIVKDSRFINSKVHTRFLVNREIKIFNSLQSNISKIQFLASRWSVKESIIKASKKSIKFYQIEILNSINGGPEVFVNNVKRDDIQVSISHEDNLTYSICIINNIKPKLI